MVVCAKYEYPWRSYEVRRKSLFTNVKLAITTNPFSSDWADIDLQLAGLTAARSDEEVFGKLNYRVISTLEEVQEKVREIRSDLAGRDLQLLRYGRLFQIFYQFSDKYDQLIQHQIEQG